MLAREGPEGSAKASPIRLLLRWLSLGVIVFLFELPAALTSTVPDFSALRLSLEAPLALTLWLVTVGLGRPRPWLLALRIATVLLVFYRFAQWLSWMLLHAEPLLYDQLFMLRHLWALLGDLMSVKTALVLLGIITTGVLIAVVVRALLRFARPLAMPTEQRRNASLLALVWCLLLVARVSQLGKEDPYVAWLTPKIARNVRKSVRTYASVQKRLRKSPYAAYAKLTLRDTPDVLLFIVESYGRLLSVEEGTSARHAALLTELENQLSAAGYHAVSAFATATVSGGRSWIAEGTFMMGTPIRYEAVFRHIVAQKPPNFVGFLNRNGYESVLLAPADRDRAGFHPENRYDFTRLVTYDQLKYPGPSIGWGLVPDQYSLAFVEQNILRNAARPIFLDFHMVSSHAPWSEVPKLEVDPTRLLAAGSKAHDEEALSGGSLVTPFHRYARGTGRHAYMRRFDDAMREGYRATIEYDLRIITQYLERREKDALVIVLGDHQPPVIARADTSFDAPIHVLSRNRERLLPLLAHGFVAGLRLDPGAPAALGHAGLFSLWVRTLMAMGCQGCALPRVLPQGDVIAR